MPSSMHGHRGPSRGHNGALEYHYSAACPPPSRDRQCIQSRVVTAGLRAASSDAPIGQLPHFSAQRNGPLPGSIPGYRRPSDAPAHCPGSSLPATSSRHRRRRRGAARPRPTGPSPRRSARRAGSVRCIRRDDRCGRPCRQPCRQARAERHVVVFEHHLAELVGVMARRHQHRGEHRRILRRLLRHSTSRPQWRDGGARRGRQPLDGGRTRCRAPLRAASRSASRRP